jgi:hypothetical protein
MGGSVVAAARGRLGSRDHTDLYGKHRLNVADFPCDEIT